MLCYCANTCTNTNTNTALHYTTLPYPTLNCLRPVQLVGSQKSQFPQALLDTAEYRHTAVLPLLGVCMHEACPCAVYPYMTNGSLEVLL
jgi:hypothetical protein